EGNAKRPRACRKSNSHIQMMKSAEKWRRQNATNGMYCSRRRRVLVDRKLRATLVIVGRVRSQQMAEMPLAEHDNVIKTFPPDRTDRPFTISILIILYSRAGRAICAAGSVRYFSCTCTIGPGLSARPWAITR